MNKNVYTILLVITSFLFITIDCKTKFSFQEKIKSLLQSNMPEKVDQKEFPATLLNSLSLSNHNGSITIKAGPKKSLFLRTTIRAKKEEYLDNIEIIVDSSKNNHLAITTKNRNKKSTGSVDYELIVPTSIAITLSVTGSGDVSIKDVHGTIDVVTNDNITLINTKKLASAQCLKKGSININNALGPVEVYTQQGNIIAGNILHSFEAHTKTGNINVTYKNVPSTSSINLHTTSGNILLALPTDTNAEIYGYTTHGTLMSEHDITLKSYTTKLNKSAWIKFTKEVDGTLGTGDATIMVQSTKGNVKIIETKMV
jgi:hypothetical protein